MLMASPLRLSVKKRKYLPEDVQLLFLKRLERFMENGYPLQDALEAIAWDRNFADLSAYFIKRLQQGEKLDVLFDETGFHPAIGSFLYFVRANSNLSEAIGTCREMMEQRFNQVKRFKLILRYPLILTIIFSVLLFFINHRVLPAFQDLLSHSSDSLTAVTILKSVMDIFQSFMLFALIAWLSIMVIWRKMFENIPTGQMVDIIRKIPLYNQYKRLQTSFQFAAHFSSLLKAGLSLREILQELKKQTKLPILSYYAALLSDHLERGLHISELLQDLPLIDKQLALIFQKNATVHVLEMDLSLYGELMLEEMHRKIIQWTTLVQPIFYIVLGLFVILIYLSIMWPMLQLIHTF